MPTSETIGTIMLSDQNNDYVFFQFYTLNGIESITDVTYYQNSSNSEVSFSNYSPDRSPVYDIYQTHIIGESHEDVNGIEEQESFLFTQN